MAMGCVGMSMDDFDRCTPSEFSAIMEQWGRQRKENVKLTWEQARFLATCFLQPYSRKTLKSTDVARFSWDADSGPTVEKGHGSIERMKELEARLNAAAQKDNQK